MNRARAVGLVLLCALPIVGGGCRSSSGFSAAKRDGTYAIFLTNSQVYFGNITGESERELMLQNIFYLQSKAATDAGDVSLLKLGNELHGPEDHMEINREHILFIEKLKEDGKVAKAIKAYKSP